MFDEPWEGMNGETLYLWNATNLMQKYAFSAEEQLAGRALERRMIESASAEIHPGVNLVKDEFGKPFWESKEAILPQMNYSHTKEWLFWGEHPEFSIGVDIEFERQQLLKIKHKFCTPEELQFCNENIQQILLIWSAKEAMYKAYGKKEVDFKEQMNVWDFEHLSDAQSGEFKGSLVTKNNTYLFDIEFRRKYPFVLTWTLLKHP